MNRLSDLQGTPVLDEGGHRIGHVFDVITEHEQAGQPPRIKALLVGRGGLARRLGIRRGAARSVPMAEILRIEPGQITTTNRGTPV